MEIIKKFLFLPKYFIIMLYTLYITYKIVEESDEYDLYQIETKEEFSEIVKPIIVDFNNKFNTMLNASNMLIWFIIIKFIFL